MRRFAVLSLMPGQPDRAWDSRYHALGVVTAEGRLVDAVRDLPCGQGLTYVCLETGHTFARARGDTDHLGTLLDLAGLPAIAQAYIREPSVALMFAASDAVRAQRALVLGAGIATRHAAEVIAYEAPLTLSRPQCLGVLIAALPRLTEVTQPIFRTIAVADTMVLG